MRTRITSTSTKGLTLIAALLVAAAACAPAAAPTPVPPSPTSATKAASVAPAATAPPAAKPTSAPAAPATATPAAKGPSNELAQLVEAAKKEGKVSVRLHPFLEVPPIREGIKKKYGVDLQIDSVPNESYATHVAAAIAEFKAGAPPSFDLLPFSDSTSLQAINAGVVEKVNWAPLLAPGTPKEVVQSDGHALSVYTGHIGLMYDPRVISAADAPKSFADLGNPKWKGKLAVYNSTANYVNYAFVRGIDKTLADLRAIMKNSPPVEAYSRGQTRYTAGEYPIVLIGSSMYGSVKTKGMPVEWVSPDISFFSVHSFHVMKGAKQPNAAKLLAIFLASPEGHKIYNDTGVGSMFYTGNIESDIHQQDVKAGLKQYNPMTWPGALDFLQSEQGKRVEQEVGRILKGE